MGNATADNFFHKSPQKSRCSSPARKRGELEKWLPGLQPHCHSLISWRIVEGWGKKQEEEEEKGAVEGMGETTRHGRVPERRKLGVNTG
jgi:hypothetical protein